MKEPNLKDKVALVTGSARGLGREMILFLARSGCKVIVHYHKSSEDALLTAELAGQAGVEVLVVQGDLTDNGQVKKIFAEVKDRFGRLDIFIHNVGDYLKKDILELTTAEWHYIMDSNLTSAFYCCKAALEIMGKGKYGRIITTGFASAGTNTAEPEITPYFIAKNGVLTLTKSLAVELAPHNITVNMISPGVLETSISKPVEEIPAGRLAELSEVINVLGFLLEPQSGYITGNNLEVSGGWRL